MILLNHDVVSSALTIDLALDAIRGALDDQAAGQVQMPPRQTTDAGDHAGGLDPRSGANWLRISAAFLNGRGVMGFKAMNRAAGLGMRYLVGLYDIESGELLSILDANEITTARTAATNALGTHLLADPGSTRVGVIGSGVQAIALIRSYASLRRLDEVLVYSPRPERRAAFAELVSDELGVAGRAVDSAEAVTDASTVLIAVRASREPVFEGRWIRPGMHVTGLSSVRFDAREVDDDTWRRADLVVLDDRTNVAVSGDARSIEASEAYDLADAHELFEAHAGRVGRTSESQVTLFKSVGNAAQDIALAAAVVGRIDSAGGGDVGSDVGAFPIVKPYV